MDEVKQMRKLDCRSYTSIVSTDSIKQNEFQKILEGLWATMEKDMPPPIGTNPIEILKRGL